MFEEDTLTPIFRKLADWIKDEILKGNFVEEEAVPSTNQLASLYHINPATAGKGLNLLVEEGILYKKRGIGMFVCSGAVAKLTQAKRNTFQSDTLPHLLEEAKSLGITKEELADMILKQER